MPIRSHCSPGLCPVSFFIVSAQFLLICGTFWHSTHNFVSMNRVNTVNLSNALIVVLTFAAYFGASSSDQVAPLQIGEYEVTTTAAIGSQELQSISAGNYTGPVEWMTDWVPPGRLREWFPVYRLGTTDDGVAVYLDRFGRYNYNKLVKEGTDEEKAAIDQYIDYVNTKIAYDGTTNGADGVIAIIDWDGYSISEYSNPEVIRLAFRHLGKLGKLYNAVKQVYSINTNFGAELFLNAVRPQLGKFFVNFQVYGTLKDKWIPQLLHSIPPHLLPPRYGGTNNEIDV